MHLTKLKNLCADALRFFNLLDWPVLNRFLEAFGLNARQPVMGRDHQPIPSLPAIVEDDPPQSDPDGSGDS